MTFLTAIYIFCQYFILSFTVLYVKKFLSESHYTYSLHLRLGGKYEVYISNIFSAVALDMAFSL